MKKEAVILLAWLIGIFILSGIILISARTNPGSDNSNNCTDSNNNTGNITKVYIDNDHDSYGTGSLVDFCLVGDIPLGYTYTNGDCNDNDSTVWKNMTVYPDNDHDGYGAGNATSMCLGSSIPEGYSNNSLDCNDNNPGVWNTIIGYLDRDSDSYGDNNPLSFCSNQLPLGYVSVNGDCNDVNPFVNPGTIDICNYIDDNCNGKIDENFSDVGKTCTIGIGECENSGIIACKQDGSGTFCKGTAKKPSPEICDGKDNDCDGLIDENNVCNDTNLSLILNSPSLATYNKKNVAVNLSLLSLSGKLADKISYIDYSAKKPKETVLCKKCNQYGVYIPKTINLQDGLHNLTFKAIINGTVLDNSITIFVDSKSPRLYLPRIRTKDFSNGSFLINYDEDNLKSITLFYDNETYTDYNCSSGKNKFCTIIADMSQYNGEDISYSFLAEDISGNTAISKNMTAEIDTIPPVINAIDYPVNGSSVFFTFNITEKNFKEVSIFDNSYDKAKWKLLCSSLADGICQKQLRLSPGEHNLTIRASDKAGNSVFVNI